MNEYSTEALMYLCRMIDNNIDMNEFRISIYIDTQNDKTKLVSNFNTVCAGYHIVAAIRFFI